MDSKKWQALKDRAIAVAALARGDRCVWSSAPAPKESRALVLANAFFLREYKEAAREALLTRGAKASVAAAAAASPSGGRFGSWSWEAAQTHDQGPVWSVWSNRRNRAWTPEKADDWYQEWKERARARQEEYNLRLSEKAREVRAGAVLEFREGPHGGTLGGVSAQGLAKRLGVEPPVSVLRWAKAPGWSPERNVWVDVGPIEASASFTRSVAGPHEDPCPLTPRDNRAVARARARRNAPATLPRVDRKRFKESRHLPT